MKWNALPVQDHAKLLSSMSHLICDNLVENSWVFNVYTVFVIKVLDLVIYGIFNDMLLYCILYCMIFDEKRYI